MRSERRDRLLERAHDPRLRVFLRRRTRHGPRRPNVFVTVGGVAQALGHASTHQAATSRAKFHFLFPAHVEFHQDPVAHGLRHRFDRACRDESAAGVSVRRTLEKGQGRGTRGVAHSRAQGAPCSGSHAQGETPGLREHQRAQGATCERSDESPDSDALRAHLTRLEETTRPWTIGRRATGFPFRMITDENGSSDDGSPGSVSTGSSVPGVVGFE